jgi:hypothetical protein
LKTKAHTQYRLKDGTRVPGVTTILGVLNKPALVPWANRLGLQGIDSTKYVDDKAEIGTCAHYLIECDVKGVDPDLSDYSPRTVSLAENGLLKWLDWKPSDFTLVGSELQLVSEQYRYGGTCDIVCTSQGKTMLVDIKTSGSGVWPEMKHQVCAYEMLLLEHGYIIDEIWILRVGRDDTEGFDAVKVYNWETHRKVFLHCRELYDLIKVAK